MKGREEGKVRKGREGKGGIKERGRNVSGKPIENT